jgi:hypothetical protein
MVILPFGLNEVWNEVVLGAKEVVVPFVVPRLNYGRKVVCPKVVVEFVEKGLN